MKQTKFLIARCLTLLILALLSTNLAWGEDKTVTWTATSGGLGTGIGTGTIKTGDYSWDYTRTLKSGDSYTGWTSNCIQLGKNGGVENVTFSTSNIPGTIKSVSIECSSYNNAHKVAIKVGTTTYKSATATAKWTTVGTITGTGTSSGKIEISVTDGTRAFYVKSISVIYEESTTPTEAHTVTFKAGTNGTCSTTSLTEASAGAGVTLPECTANDGYVFKGWSTTESGTTPDAGVAGETYKPSSNCTLYAVYTKTYVLTITQPEAGGTLTVKNGETELKTGATVEVGTNLTCEVTDIPEGKRFSRFYVAYDGGKEIYKQTNPATFDNIPTEGITAATFTVTYKDLPKYTINYMINGVNTDAQVYEGIALVFPTVNDFGGKVFVGWSDAEIAEATDEKPALVETAGLTATANATYYAVFATKRVGEEKSEELTNDAIKSWGKLAYNTEKTYEGTDLNYSIFGYTDADDRHWIQLKKDKGVYVKITAPSNIKKVDVKITSASNSSGGINDISKHTAFSGMVGLVTTDCNFSTSSENVGSTEEVKDYIATISVSGEAKELYLKVSAGARVWSITTHYGTPDSYLGYCTTVASRTQDVEIASSGYSSFSSTYAVTIPEGVAAYYATGVEDNKVSMIEVEGGVIPANEGVIIKGVASQEYTFIETVSDKSFEGNCLVAVSERIEGLAPEVTIDNVVYKNYVFTGGQFHPFTSGATVNVGAGKAYLQVEKTSDTNAKLEMSFGDVTGIKSLTPALSEGKGVYNLNGMKVNEAYKGIVIMNGKKYINK